MKYFTFIFFFQLSFCVFAQDDLLKALEDSAAPQGREYDNTTFKATRIINGQSVKTQAKGVLQFLISHRFGAINTGIAEFYGLDQAVIRLGLDYSLTDNFTFGIGRSSFEKTYDGFVKWAFLRQTTDKKIPITLAYFGSFAIDNRKFEDAILNDAFDTRVTYTSQLLIAHKFNKKISIQLMPTLIHRNLVKTNEEENTVYALGAAGRFKLTNRLALVGEYYALLSENVAEQYKNSIAIGFDIETGGHVFQLHFANSQGLIEKFFIPQTTGDVSAGDVFFGFNISRVFNLKKR